MGRSLLAMNKWEGTSVTGARLLNAFAKDPTKCPLCGTPWSRLDTGVCDHDPDWYREFLAWLTREM